MDVPRPPLSEYRYEFGDEPFYVGRHCPGARFPVQESPTRQHFHAGLELGGVAGGNGVLLFNDVLSPLRTGTLFFLDPMLPHETWGRTLDLVVAHVTRESVVDAHIDKGGLRLLEPFVAVRNGSSPVVNEAQEVIALLLRAHAEYERGTPAGRQHAFLGVLETIELLCERLERLGPAQQSDGGQAGRMAARVLQYIRDNAALDIGMPEIAAFAGLSASSVFRLFQAHAGLSPIEFRNRERIRRAQERIVMTNEKVSSIALSCGFNNVSQFYRMFRKFVGAAPGDMRNSATEGGRAGERQRHSPRTRP